MRHLDTNDFMFKDTATSEIYTMEDEKKMRQDFLEQLKLLIDFDAADFYLSSDTDSFRRTYTFSLYPISRRSGKKRKRKRTEPPRVKNSIDLTKFATE